MAKARKRFGEAFDEQKFRETNPRVLENAKKRDELHARYTEAMQGPDLSRLSSMRALWIPSPEPKTGLTCASST